MKKCYHSLECGFIVLRPVCNFSNFPSIIAYFFGRSCPFQFDEKNCAGYLDYVDPRAKENQRENEE